MTIYAVLGAGRQGTAAAYDMARWDNAHRIIIADRDMEAARRAADRVNRMVGAAIAEPVQVDGTDLDAVERLLRGMERATGWSAAIVAGMLAHGRTPRGAGGVETFVPSRPFVEEMRRRGLNVTERVAFLDG
jgi:saccharopine dehydrogenase-like NADP-dependent oxidoreductase